MQLIGFYFRLKMKTLLLLLSLLCLMYLLPLSSLSSSWVVSEVAGTVVISGHELLYVFLFLLLSSSIWCHLCWKVVVAVAAVVLAVRVVKIAVFPLAMLLRLFFSLLVMVVVRLLMLLLLMWLLLSLMLITLASVACWFGICCPLSGLIAGHWLWLTVGCWLLNFIIGCCSCSSYCRCCYHCWCYRSNCCFCLLCCFLILFVFRSCIWCAWCSCLQRWHRYGPICCQHGYRGEKWPSDRDMWFATSILFESFYSLTWSLSAWSTFGSKDSSVRMLSEARDSWTGSLGLFSSSACHIYAAFGWFIQVTASQFI